MDTIQLTFSDTLYGKVKASHKIYAKKILYALYPNNSLSEFDIISKFNKKYSKILSASIKDLEECNLIINITSSKTSSNEKKYVLTNHGKQLIQKYIGSMQ